MFSSRLCFLAPLLLGALVACASDLDREIVLTPQTGTSAEDAEIRHWQERAEANRAVAEDFDQLAWAFVAKARRTLDGAYYTLAEKTIAVREAQFGSTADSRLLRGHVLHNEHRFAEAETLARALTQERGHAEDFALLSDALMEQGKLADAIGALQRAADLRPGPEMSSRIAHLRWLKGDLAGATAAMEDAARATSPCDVEMSAWTLMRLSGFYLQAGRFDTAFNAADLAAKHTPDYPPALLARGRALLALGKNDAAVIALTRAAELNPLPEYQWWLADALRAANRADAAIRIETAIKHHGAATDPRTLALFLSTRREDAPLAVRLARDELGNRSDVLTHDALAWALYASGDLTAADTEMRAALAEHTQDARLFFHVAVIAQARGERETAETFSARAKPLAGTLTPSERAQLAPLVRAAVALTN